MHSHGATARFLFGGAGLLLVFSACSDNSAPAVGAAVATTTTTVVAVAPSVVAAADPTAATTAVPTAAATTLPVDGAKLLQQAVAATGSGYHFNQTATVDGAVALTVDGDRLPDGARLRVTSPEAGLVSYVITPAGRWLMPDGGEWEVDDSAAPAVDPIAALGAPTSVAVASSDGTTVQLTVSVPLAALGLEGDGDTPLQVSIVSGALTSITYSTTTADGKAAVATTVIGPVVDPSPVVAPI